MSYIQKKMTEGEELIYSTRPHWIVFIKPFFKLLLLGVMISLIEGYRLYNLIPWPDAKVYLTVMEYKKIAYSLLLIIFFILPFLESAIHKYTTEIGITNQRILSKRGWLAIELQGMPLGKVENIDSGQSISGRIFNYGNVTVKGSGSTPMVLRGISKPMRFRNTLAAQIDESKSYANRE